MNYSLPTTIVNRKYALIFLPVILVLAAFSMLAPGAAIALCALIVVYIFFGQYAWFLAVIAPLGLVFGTIINFEVKPGWNYEISLGEIFLLAAFLMHLMEIAFNHAIVKLRMTGLGWLLLAYLALGVVSIWHVHNYELYVAGLKVLSFGFMGYFLALNLIDSAWRKRMFFYSLALSAFILSAEIFYKFIAAGFSSRLIEDRHIGIPIGAIALVAAILAFLLPLLLGYYFSTPRQNKLRVFILVTFFLGFVATFIMLGKAALISLFLGLGFLFFKLKPKRIAFVLFTAFFLLIGYIGLHDYAIGFIERVTMISSDSTTQFRILEYKTAFKIIKDNLWFGVGSGQQLELYQRMLYPDYSEAINNYFLQAIVDYGVIGLALLICIFLTIFAMVRKKLRLAGPESVLTFAFAGSLLAVAFNGLVEVTVFALPYAILLWLVIGVYRNINPQAETGV